VVRLTNHVYDTLKGSGIGGDFGEGQVIRDQVIRKSGIRGSGNQVIGDQVIRESGDEGNR